MVPLRCGAAALHDPSMNGPDDRWAQRPPEKPRSEPEIIPPGGRDRDSRQNVWLWVADGDGVRSANVRLPSPFLIAAVLAVVALVAAAIILVVLGAVLIWIPILLAVIGAVLLAAAVRQRWYRFKRWLAQR
jgi:hypothetical protein